ncbi:MAG: (2Fe-2S)-binding protein [Ignavibacteria bacterium]|nr:(2Fe-2S)-binding protein [Ignavibacteria bacterium]
MKKIINLTIDDQKIAVDEGTTILEAARKSGIKIPTLCYHEDLCIAGNCRICVVEQENMRSLPAACATPVSEGMVINTNSTKVRNARKFLVELLLSEHNADCTACVKNRHCELQTLAEQNHIREHTFIDLKDDKNYTIDKLSPAIIIDYSKCIRCQRCVRTCEEIQAISALSAAYKGKDMKITTFFEKPINTVVCSTCGQCVAHCPTGALTEHFYIDEVWDAINDPDKHVVVQTAPSVRVALGEEFGLKPGTIVTGKMVAALRRLGFDEVEDTDFTADLTVIEEGNELLRRLKAKLADKDESVKLPMVTTCSPAWVKYCEHAFSDLLGHLSTCKSPMSMFGALSKTYYAEKFKLDPAKIVSVAIMPCIAKKFESNRPEMRASGYKDTDYVLTTRELAIMIKQAGIDFNTLKDSSFDSLMGVASGAGLIFGNSGGVMEAALRCAYMIVVGKDIPFEDLSITPLHGSEGEIVEMSVKFTGTKPEWSFLEGVTVNVAHANMLSNAYKIMEEIKNGTSKYHFVEIMSCPGGCIGGAGQPLPTTKAKRTARKEAIYSGEKLIEIRKSQDNPEIINIYDDYLGKPLEEKAHKLLHVPGFTPRKRY